MHKSANTMRIRQTPYLDGFGGKHNSLFRPGPNAKLNACVGRNGGPANLSRYATGYFDAGARLIKSLQDDQHWVDCLVYPVVMVYRHAIEIALKHLAKKIPPLFRKESNLNLTHKLLDNWMIIRPLLRQLGLKNEELDPIEQKLYEFIQIDPYGETFRYPEARDGSLQLQETSLINLEVFGEEMKLLSDFFEGCMYWLEDVYERKAEEVQEQREREREVAECMGWSEE